MQTKEDEAKVAAKQQPYKIAFFIALAVVMWKACSQVESSAPSRAAQAAPAVDLARPVFTQEGAFVCPISVLSDKRQGKGLQAANEAAAMLFGRDEAVKEAGCERWRAGIHVLVDNTPDRGWLPFFDGGRLMLVFKQHLVNGPDGAAPIAAPPPVAIQPAEQPASEPAPLTTQPEQAIAASAPATKAEIDHAEAPADAASDGTRQ